MTTDMLLVFGLLVAAVVLFASERLRVDVVAILLLLALMLTGLLTPAEALAGFSDPIVLIIAGLFIVGGGLTQTGVAAALGRLLARMTGGGESVLVAVVMVSVALMSAFMSSTGATAILLPVVVSLAWSARVSPSKLLLPLSLGSLLGGLLTLIGTPPNLVVSGQLASEGLKPFGFFSFTPVGLVMLVIGVAYMVLVGRRMLPDRSRHSPALAASELPSLNDLATAYRLPGFLFRVRVRQGSPMIGRTLEELDLRVRYHVTVLEIQNWPEKRRRPAPAEPVTPETVIRLNDVLHVQATPESVTLMAQNEVVGVLPQGNLDRPLISDELGMVELLLTPRSRLSGKTLTELSFRDRYNVTVLSVMRRGEPMRTDVATTPLRFGDTLLVQGTWEKIGLLRGDTRDFVIVGQPREMLEAHLSTKRAPWAIAIMLGMLVLMVTEIVPAVTAVLLAAVVMVLSRCLTMEEAYSEMNWTSVVLLAGTLPLATALQKTGGALGTSLGQLGPLAMMAGLFVITALLSQFTSNTATTVLLAPIAFQVARSMGVSPQTFLMTVAVAASTSFATPISTTSNTLVLGPGGYRFGDYFKVGISLQLIMMAATMLIVPLLFPL
jgi:di/tricarboxylate transporter